MKRILVTGGSGMLGRYLGPWLLSQDHEVSFLNYSSAENRSNRIYHWNPMKGILPSETLSDIDIIINLAGAGIANKPWTKKRKQVLLASRQLATRLLVAQLMEQRLTPKIFINASAIGYYGNRPQEPLSEESKPGSGFLSKLCMAWEGELQPLQQLKIPSAILRFGIILSKKGGSLPKLLAPFKLGINPLFGDGHQNISWIHIEDVIAIIGQLIEEKLPATTFNLVSPSPVSQRKFNATALSILDKKTISLKLNRSLLKIAMGEMSSLFLDEQEIIPSKLLANKYAFKYDNISEALESILSG